MSAALAVVPYLWAVEEMPDAVKPKRKNRPRAKLIEPQWAFYRKHTEGMLRRYMRFSLETGRVPSLLGKEMFRGLVTSYKMESFDDLVIFVHDMDRCMKRVSPLQRLLLARIAIQEYTPEETAQMLRASRRTVVRRYEEALDRLTGVLLEVRLLEPLKICQVAESGETTVTVSFEGRYSVS